MFRLTKLRLLMTALAAVVIGAACGSPQSSPDTTIPSTISAPTPDVPTREPTPFIPHITPSPSAVDSGATENTLAVVDTSKASVPLDQIFFDTFEGPFVRLSSATDELISDLRDRIPPLNHPEYLTVGEVDYLGPDDLVLSYSSGDEHYAYPFQLLNFHEFVNEEIGDIPILISYCPLCRSGIVFDRRVDGQVLTFGNTSALYEGNAIAYDKETGSYWHQASGSAIVGSLTGKRLKSLPSLVTTWEEWSALYPAGRVLSTNTGYAAPYDRDVFAGFENMLNGERFIFPLSNKARDPRLQLGTHVLVVMAGGSVKAYDLDALGDAIINDVVGGERVVVFSKASGPSGAAYRPSLDGQDLTFQLREGHIVDDTAGTTWDLSGRATAGRLEGAALEPIPALFTFWFGAVVSYPGIDLYEP